MRRKLTEIIIETDELLILRPAAAPLHDWCERCGSQVERVTPEAAALRMGGTTRKVYRLVESGLVHFFETPGGSLLICATSLPPRI